MCDARGATVVVVVVFEASSQRAYWRVILASANFDGRERASENALCCRSKPGASLQPVLDYLRLLFTKETQWVCGGVDELGTRFSQRSVTGSKACKESHIRTFANCFVTPFTNAVRDLAGGGSLSVLRMRGLADTQEMG